MRLTPTVEDDEGQQTTLFVLISEVRAVAVVTAMLATMPALLRAPRGDGHPVMVIPGLLAGDLSTAHLRRHLGTLGYNVHPWRLGRNTGGVSKMVSTVQSRIAEIRQATDRKVSLIGSSLGAGTPDSGPALTKPDHVRFVTGLCEMRRGRFSNLSEIYRRVAGESDATRLHPDLARDLRVPTTAIYSKSDGIVNWRSSALVHNHQSENVEILLGSHIGLGGQPLRAVGDRGPTFASRGGIQAI